MLKSWLLPNYGVYFKWAFWTFVDILLHITFFWRIAPIFVSLFTRAADDLDEYTPEWGWMFGTWDNPPQGDTKHQREGFFPGALYGFKGYAMRVQWLWRNPGYNFQKWVGIPYTGAKVEFSGNPDISDKGGRAGSYFATVHENGKLIAFEYYIIKPYKRNPNKCFRMRIGYKLLTDKYERYGFATMVNTIQPYKSYDLG